MLLKCFCLRISIDTINLRSSLMGLFFLLSSYLVTLEFSHMQSDATFCGGTNTLTDIDFAVSGMSLRYYLPCSLSLSASQMKKGCLKEK